MTNVEKLFMLFSIEPHYVDMCTIEDEYWADEDLQQRMTFDMYMDAKCGHQEECTTQCPCAYTKEIGLKLREGDTWKLFKFLTDRSKISFDHNKVKIIIEETREYDNKTLEENIAQAIIDCVPNMCFEDRNKLESILENVKDNNEE